MGRPASEDWEGLRKKYLVIRATGKKITLKQFASDEAVAYAAMSHAFKKLADGKQSNNQTIR